MLCWRRSERRSRLVGYWVIALVLLTPISVLAQEPPRSFAASYTAKSRGLTLGSVELRLERSGTAYEYWSGMQASGPLALLYRERIREYSRGEISASGVQPLSYDYQRQGGSTARDDGIRFGAADGRAVVRYKGETRTDGYPTFTQDPLSLHLALMQDVARGQTKMRYLVAQPRLLRAVEVAVVGRDKIRVAGGTYEAVRVEVVAEQRVRTLEGFELATAELAAPKKGARTTFWLAPELDYLPVLIRYADPDDGAGELHLQSLEPLHAAEPAGT